MKLFTKLRKKLWLPVKFKQTNERIRKSLKFRSKKEVFDMMKDIKKQLVLVERIEKEPELTQYKAQLEILDWITCRSAE
jgi:cell fate (sporulation/competence/biofilm development) regulator YmcA (YheA/YmcA/DUF963 family)|tara:strand:- start:94 stop:330 length:237 start_codon:yes stop_codon:yes gene_type:complete